jgi:hypothetical protein
VLVAALGAPLTSLALLFGPAEYFSLMVLGLIFAVVLAKGSVLKAVAMVLTGLLLSMVGSDLETGAGRMTFDIAELADGIGFANIAMGVFGFAEIIRNLELPAESRDIVQAKITGLMPTRKDLIDSAGAIVRGTALGSLLGILPGGGAVIASFAAYTFEKKIAKDPSRFGRGAIEGVAAPESANNAAAQTSFIPLLTLGIPPNAVMALMVGAMTIHGIVPGPQVMTKQPELFWGMISSMWIGNLMLIVINLPLVGLDHRVLLHRHLFHQQLSDRRADFSDLRRHRFLAGQTRLRAGADATRLCPGTVDGRKSAAGHADRSRRCDRVFHATDLRGPAHHRHYSACHCGVAEDPPPSGRGFCRVGRLRDPIGGCSRELCGFPLLPVPVQNVPRTCWRARSVTAVALDSIDSALRPSSRDPCANTWI